MSSLLSLSVRARGLALVVGLVALGVFTAPASAQRLTEGRTCATPIPTEAEARQNDAAIRAWLDQNGGAEAGGDVVTIPVAFHVIRSGTAVSQGNVTDQMIADQMQVLNDAFLSMGYRFVLATTTRTTNATWYTGCADSQEDPMKQALNVDPARFLNIYTCSLGGGLLGYAYLPNSDEDAYYHGVVVLHSSLPGGSAFPYNEGDTGTHEVGHYVGLYHTFDFGCDSDTPPGCETGGDRVCDTASEASPAFTCQIGRNTCATGGPDPIHNFMDYPDDACMFEFTPGQAERALAQMSLYRPTIMSDPAAFIAPEELVFGDVFVGETATDSVFVINLSDEPLEITSITSDNDVFTPAVSSITVPATSATTLDVTFTPDSGAPETGTLTLVTTSSEVGTVTVALSGNGLVPSAIVSLPVPGLAGEAAVGADDTETLTVSNVGTGALDFSFESLPTWISDVTPNPGTIEPGGSEEVAVTMSAAGLSTGVYQHLVRFLSNDAALDTLDLHAVFAVGGAFPPPALLTPFYASDNVPTDYTLTWLAVPDAAVYDVEVADDENFTSVVESGPVEGTTVAFLADPGTTLYWRVRSVDDTGTESEWSLPFVFTTTSAVATEPDAAPPTRVVLGTAYPNPSHGGVAVPFSLAETRPVTLHVYDVTGRLVVSLAEGQPFPAGAHTLHWEAGTLPAGVYLVRLVAGDEAATGRVALVR